MDFFFSQLDLLLYYEELLFNIPLLFQGLSEIQLGSRMRRIMTALFWSQRASTLFVRVKKLWLIFQDEGKFNWSGLLLFAGKKEKHRRIEEEI